MKQLLLATLLVLAVSAATISGASAASSGLIEGRVTAAGRAIPNAVVTAGGVTAHTDRAGRFRMAPFAVADGVRLVDVIVRARGYGEWKLASARVVSGDTLRITAELSRGPVRLVQPKPRALTASTSPTATYAPSASSGSQAIPPGSIRVYVTGSTQCSTSASGTVQIVEFRDYVKHVLPNEWFASWPEESLRSGAMAVKSYAWYQVNRGGKWPSLGADVMDSTCDQVYNPAVSYASTDKAVDDTWGYRLTRDDSILMAQYYAGARDDGSKPTGTYAGRLTQWGSEYWARQGWSWDDILYYYYGHEDTNTYISPITDADLRLVAGPSVSSATVTWGEPITVSFTVKNMGTQAMQLSELFAKLRGPNGEVADLGGDGNSTAILPGEERRAVITAPAAALSAPGSYGQYTLVATYRDTSGLIAPGIPPAGVAASTTFSVSVVKPAYGSSIVSISNAAPSYYEATSADVIVKLKNTGNTTWYPGTSATHNAVRLATALPTLRSSPFYLSGFWLSPSRIPMIEPQTGPGGTGTFRVRLSGSVAPGSYTEAFKLRSEGSLPGGFTGVFGSQLSLTPKVLDDAAPPSAVVSPPPYSTASSAGLLFPVRWSGSDAQSGVARYEVQWLNGSSYQTWLTATGNLATFGSGGKPVSVQPARTYYFRVRAVDRAGNVGGWSVRRFTSVPADDTSLTYAGKWGAARATSAAHFMRTVHFASTAGASARYTFYGRQVGWISNTGPDKGRAEVWVDGARVATVSLYSSSYRLRQPVFQKWLGSRNARHTVEVRVLGSKVAASRGTRIDVDGIAFVR